MFSRVLKRSGKIYRKRDSIKRSLFNVNNSVGSEIFGTTGIITAADVQSSDSSDSEDEYGAVTTDSNEFDTMDFEEGMQFWALYTNQTHQSINMMLKLLKSNIDSVNLPENARTLLRTKRTPAEITKIDGGQFWYNGIQKCLSSFFCKQGPPFETLSLNLFVDGLPLYKSSSLQFWPILFNIHDMPNVRPMIAGIFCGNTKPGNADEYLKKLVEELKIILVKGTTINGVTIAIKLRAVIADSPARCFLKGVTNFNGYNSCLKCTCHGEYNHDSHTVIFKGVNHKMRTDKNFRAKAYRQHQKKCSPLLEIPFLNMIRDIIVSDRLHLIDLGVQRRLFLGWRDGTLGLHAKLSASAISEISELLQRIKLPSEIHRPFRGLNVLKYWKATEFSSFLHYAGIVVLKDVLPDYVYNHFLLLFCSITMLSTNVYKNNWHVANEMLKEFVVQYSNVYGDKFLTSTGFSRSSHSCGTLY
ncbi:uncharacterized protein LOC121593323 isoform X1 [Anopheles merus]|uniref:uncharacterized protein LOC121593323 isoform X1 n=2 Tax=Anopheles merus TaxID=30066 RepID=UPI001BE4A9F6|nr:uncharacterized protein LOC121593323 isoform X1 [Anopheles merus]